MIMKKTWGESMIQVAVALFDVRPHEWSHMRSPPATSSHLIIFILMISIIPIYRSLLLCLFLDESLCNFEFAGQIQK